MAVQLNRRNTDERLTEFADLIEHLTGRDGSHETAIPSLRLIRSTSPTLPVFTVYEPSLCIAARGTKVVTLAGETYRYGAGDCFVVSVDLPVTSQLIDASPEAPYLCFRLDFDLGLALDVMKTTERSVGDNGSPEAGNGNLSGRGLFVGKLEPDLLDAVTRLVRLLEKPQDIPYLAPLIVREIFYRILSGSEGEAFRRLAMTGSGSNRIADVIARIKRDFAQTLPIEELARIAHMGPSSLHRHFKEVTAMSPLQYQKRLRLQEARRLLLTEEVDAADAAFRVGYESPSQFSREYARMFGLPPIADIRRLRTSPDQEIG
ncbi:AraC family transcriptional regulator [Cohnella zeiphila]|uniref:AraC family transcriptional regulator n=1 Tax=Cohnella zeiphila TaxID=2761120 RepID=A0A7X0VV30_9BACL|nr:AraC family transcriptional regulator [Cohnella zeiphila]MBB6729488.1 AraC family transcriptional regulator [Cohnella zeiphila]